MSLLNECKVLWSNGPGLPGTNTFHFSPSTVDMSVLQGFYSDLEAFIPSGITVRAPGEGSTLNVESGELEGLWSGVGGTATVGTGAGDYAGGVGATIRWDTSGVVGGHHIRGRSFLVPLISQCFDDNGTLDDGVKGTIKAAGDALIDYYDGNLRVWHRPAGGSGGSLHTVVDSFVPDRAAWLKTRRA